MPTFAWEGRMPGGRARKGVLKASNSAEAIAQLKKRRIESIKVKERRFPFQWIGFQKKVEPKELAIFTRHLSTMIDAGLPLVQSLQALAEQQKNERFSKILFEVKQRVESGASLSDALSLHKGIFSELYRNLVSAGEAAGALDGVLHRLAVYMEKAYLLRKQVKSAMSYPLVILGVTLTVVVVILTFVTPKFEAVFEDFGQALPAPTAFLVWLSDIVRENLVWALLGLGGLLGGIRSALRVPKIRAPFDRFILRTPLVGTLMIKISIARFSRTLSTLLSSGVPILDALNICSKSVVNLYLEEEIQNARIEIRQGKAISEPFQKVKIFPPMVVQMISVGESTGKLDKMLGKIADFYEEEVESTVSTLTSLLEPVMIVILGGAVTGILIAMYLPIFNLAGAIM